MGLIIIFGLSVVLIAWFWSGIRWERSGVWTFAHGGRMKRYINGQWQYRPQTEEEAFERLEMSVW